jgi:hypothetical protein
MTDHDLSLTKVGDKIAEHINEAHGTIVSPVEILIVDSQLKSLPQPKAAQSPEKLNEPTRSARMPLQTLESKQSLQGSVAKPQLNNRPATARRPNTKDRKTTTVYRIGNRLPWVFCMVH